MSGNTDGAAPFVSPLLATTSALTAIDFGSPPPDPAIQALAARMNAAVMALADALPPDLRPEAQAVLRGYGGGDRLFVELFYRPVWSFLHWLPSPGEAMLAVACRVQAMALFLHLWDDHLSDGQLTPDLMRLHLRSLAWQAFSDGAEQLRRAAGTEPEAVDALVAGYLSTVHRPGVAETLDAHAERMVQQVGIWRVVPLLYGRLVGGAAAACTVVERFSVAWRLIDDVQDAAEDAVSGQQNALALALDPDGRAAWDICRTGPEGLRQGWPGVEAALARNDVRGEPSSGLAVVLTRAQREVDAAGRAAESMGWTGLAAELAACRVGRPPTGDHPV